jgi:hypothetical protein
MRNGEAFVGARLCGCRTQHGSGRRGGPGDHGRSRESPQGQVGVAATAVPLRSAATSSLLCAASAGNLWSAARRLRPAACGLSAAPARLQAGLQHRLWFPLTAGAAVERLDLPGQHTLEAAVRAETQGIASLSRSFTAIASATRAEVAAIGSAFNASGGRRQMDGGYPQPQMPTGCAGWENTL